MLFNHPGRTLAFKQALSYFVCFYPFVLRINYALQNAGPVALSQQIAEGGDVFLFADDADGGDVEFLRLNFV